MLFNHPEMYIDYINTSLELVCQLCFSSDQPHPAHERFTVNLLNLMKDILNNDSYRPQTININREWSIKYNILLPLN